MATPGDAEVSGAGGMRALTLATVFAAASGFLVMGIAAKALGPGPYADFAAYWGLFFALGGVANGLMQEATRGVRATATGAAPGTVRLLPAGALMGLGLASLVLLSWVFWPLMDLDTHSGAAVVVMAAGILGFSLQAATAGALSGTGRWGLYGVLLTIDAALRLAVAGVAWALGLEGMAFAFATVAGAVTWALLLVAAPGVRSALAARPDVDAARFWRNTGTAMLASAGTAALVVGFPVLIKATSHADPPALVGAVVLAVTFTRAPLLVPLTSFQSAIIVYFVERLTQGVRAVVVPVAAIVGVGLLGAGAAWLVGPWLLRTLIDDAFALPGIVLAGLTLASVGTATLMVTGNAALAHERHGAYNAGWWVAVAASVALLLALPWSLDVRATVALLAGPAVGVVVHLAALRRPGPSSPRPSREVRSA